MKTYSDRPKVFGVGLNRTGTTTLGQCGNILGFRCTSCDRGLLEDFVLRNDFSKINDLVGQYQLFEDWPWPLIYEELDQVFPESKFILTVRRSDEAWLKSLKNHSMRTHPTRHCRKLAYGFAYPHKHESEHLEFYRRHNEGVRTYFSNRPSDFIELCWESGDGFEELCSFLGRNIPDAPLPHANAGKNNPARVSRYWMNWVLSLIS